MLEVPLELPELPEDTPPETHAPREICEFKGHPFWRLWDRSQWQPYDLDFSDAMCMEQSQYLSIVLQTQSSGRNHWSLFLAE